MHVVLDHLTSIIVAGFVILIIMAMLALRAEESQETTRTYVTQQAVSGFTKVLEADLENMGVQLPMGVSVITTLTADNFTFWGLDGPEGNSAQITYSRTAVGALDSLTLYRIDRYVDGVADGAIDGEVTQFAVTLLDNDGVPVPESGWDDVRQVFLRVERATAYARTGERAAREAVRVQGWGSTVRPIALQ